MATPSPAGPPAGPHGPRTRSILPQRIELTPEMDAALSDILETLGDDGGDESDAADDAADDAAPRRRRALREQTRLGLILLNGGHPQGYTGQAHGVHGWWEPGQGHTGNTGHGGQASHEAGGTRGQTAGGAAAQTQHARGTGPGTNGAGDKDEDGQQMPFTKAEWQHARDHGAPLHARAQRNYANEVTAATIRGKPYIIKEVRTGNMSHTHEYKQQEQESSTVVAAKALGLGEVVPKEVYHVMDRDANGMQRHYSIQSHEPGRSFLDAARPGDITDNMPEATLARAFLAQYALGMRDRHTSNVLYTPGVARFGARAEGTLTLIDHGHSFKTSRDIEKRDAVRDAWMYKLFKAGKNGDMAEMIMPRALVHNVVSHEQDMIHALEQHHYNLDAAQWKGLRDRFTVLRDLLSTHPGDISVLDLADQVGISRQEYIS